MQLALEEINAKGGVLGGRRLEFIFRDDGGTTGDATRVAEELVTRENVSMLAGTFLSNIGLAVADYAGVAERYSMCVRAITALALNRTCNLIFPGPPAPGPLRDKPRPQRSPILQSGASGMSHSLFGSHRRP
jgi:ABC-type branched-subunit amino acid transport system substrate-binding protein